MSYVDYDKAQKAGLKAFKTAVANGDNEYLPVLDEILEGVDIQSEVSLGLVQIPLDRVVGTSNVGRTYAFANNFMPILDYRTEFGSKWSSLCDSHLEEGIRDPIKVYEYMNYYYVVEGNKRVSVLKYFDAVNVPAMVTRKVPKLTDDPQVKLYYEFMEFNKLTTVNYIWFSEEGSFKKMLELTSDDPTVPWTVDQIKDFGSAHHHFACALKSKGGDKLPMTVGDAFLIFISIYGYDKIKDLMEKEMCAKLDTMWAELTMESEGGKIDLKLEPEKSSKKNILEHFYSSAPKKLMVAFVFDKDPDKSDWLYSHELGRLYIEEHFGEKVKTLKVHNLQNEEDAITAMEDLVLMGVNVIFTTSAQQISASLKIAASHPEVRVMNCSINTVHKIIDTYYARMYEVKYLAGMIAGAMTHNDLIGYVADYPIVGTTANINAFALGAKAINPYAEVVVKWTSVKGVSRDTAIENFRKEGIKYVSDQITLKAGVGNRKFGLYYIDGDDITNIAAPIYDWGAFYSKIIEGILDGSLKKDKAKNEAINYWWGLSAGVVDLICSKNVPDGTARIVEAVKQLMIKKDFSPFAGEIKSKDGTIKHSDKKSMEPSDIVNMNWLIENVIGEIPEMDDLKEEAKSIVELKGVIDENTSAS